jgi:nicotinate phosphoribosyltransferase
MEMIGVRIDSGDLAHLSIEIRKLLDKAGFPAAKIMASNELDEHIINDLKHQGAKVNVWGVGTNLVTGKDQPALDGVYKYLRSKMRKANGNIALRFQSRSSKSPIREFTKCAAIMMSTVTLPT